MQLRIRLMCRSFSLHNHTPSSDRPLHLSEPVWKCLRRYQAYCSSRISALRNSSCQSYHSLNYLLQCILRFLSLSQDNSNISSPEPSTLRHNPSRNAFHQQSGSSRCRGNFDSIWSLPKVRFPFDRHVWSGIHTPPHHETWHTLSAFRIPRSTSVVRQTSPFPQISRPRNNLTREQHSHRHSEADSHRRLNY